MLIRLTGFMMFAPLQRFNVPSTHRVWCGRCFHFGCYCFCRSLRIAYAPTCIRDME